MPEANSNPRVALLGNLCDNAVIFREFFAAIGFPTDVYMDRDELDSCTIASIVDMRDNDPEALFRGPKSIVVWDEWPALGWLRRMPGGRSVYFLACLLRLLWGVRRADVVVSFAMYHIPGWLSRRPHMAFCTGADLHEVAIERGHRGWLMRRALRAAAFVGSGLDPLSRRNSASLGLASLHAFYIPWPIPPSPISLDEHRGPVRVFMASRLDWCDESRHGIAKRNDLFLRAWARRVLEGWDSRFVIVAYGDDVAATRRLVIELGVADRVDFIDKLSQPELQREVEAADMVADQFDQGMPGVLALQALAAGRALAVYLDPASTYCYATVPPVLSGNTEEALYQGLLSLSTRDALAELGRQGHVWMTHEYGWPRIEHMMRTAIGGATRQPSVCQAGVERGAR